MKLTDLDDFWGKLDRDAGTWHPLVHHCADVAACCERILRVSSLKHRLEVLAERELADVDLDRLCVIAALHDIGKFCLGFQNKATVSRSETSGHVAEALGPLFTVRSRVGESIIDALGEVIDWDPELAILAAAICHHGKPQPDRLVEWVWRDTKSLQPVKGIKRLVAKCREWFPAAFVQGPPLPSAHPFTHAFAGVMMLADWLGSSRSAFPYSESHDDRMAFARRASEQLLIEMGLDTNAARQPVCPSFQAFTGYDEPRSAQKAVLELPTPTGGSLAFVEAETGSGKTEAALGRFFALHHRREVDGLYFAVPTRAAASQLHRRIHKATVRAFGDKAPPVTLALPGYLKVNDEYGRKLDDFEVLWNENDDAHRHRGWSVEHPKRYFAGGVIVGTIDQVLLSTLMTSHAHLRAAGLLRLLLVVDEAHASDAYMTRLVEHVLRFQLQAGGHALVMSATLGSVARHRFERLVDAAAAMPSLEEAIATPYPRVALGTEPSAIEPSGDAQKAVQWRAEPWADDHDSMLELVSRAVGDGARVLIIRNTVQAAVATQRAIEAAGLPTLQCNTVPAPHHSRFARTDRRALDRAIERVLGKQRQGDSGLAVVATQTVEQSLDIDADLLLTDLCPMDVLLQRIGRLHRHARPRPPGFEVAHVIVLVPDALQWTDFILPKSGLARGPHGLGTVYVDLRILRATYELIEAGAEIEIPRDNRELVEKATHTAAMPADSSPLWKTHAACVDGSKLSDSLLAELNWVRRDRDYAQHPFPDDRRMVTRLGVDDRHIELPEPTKGPFGRDVYSLKLNGHVANRLEIPFEPEVIIQDAGDDGFSLSIHGKPFRYDRFGLQPVEQS